MLSFIRFISAPVSIKNVALPPLTSSAWNFIFVYIFPRLLFSEIFASAVSAGSIAAPAFSSLNVLSCTLILVDLGSADTVLAALAAATDSAVIAGFAATIVVDTAGPLIHLYGHLLVVAATDFFCLDSCNLFLVPCSCLDTLDRLDYC
ncbi:GSCOCG00012508001-RA-CDS [Cotesia congregata]|nr:GSCOCG00012508001-RA-CDS [Cotesia congregata]